MGRNRKALEDKNTTLMLKLDNRTVFKLCDKFGIEYDKNAEMIDNEIKNKLSRKIIEML